MTSVTTKIDRKDSATADPEVCHCHSVRASEIQSVIDEDCEDTVEGVGRRTSAGTGCGACRCKIQRMLAGMPLTCGPCGFCTGCGTIKKLCTCPTEELEAAAA